jgi:RNA polymerase sigma-70 factor (ECF subfamily)
MATQNPEFEFDSAGLIRRAQSGDADAFSEIVNFFRARIISYCWKMVGANAEDVAQEIFVKFYLSLDRFDPSKPIGPFLFRIAHNQCVDVLKKKRIRTIPLLHSVKDDEKLELQIRDDRPDPEASVQNAELRQAIQGALAKVPVRYRSPLIMWHVEGLSYVEISQTLDLPLGTVKARIHRGRKLMQQKLAGFVSMNGG